jgi:hypothetical protein
MKMQFKSWLLDSSDGRHCQSAFLAFESRYTFVSPLAERARDWSSVANAETFSIPPATMTGIVLDVAVLAPAGAKISKLART